LWTLTLHNFIDFKELALKVTTDPEHKFDLSLQLDDLDAALDITRSLPAQESATKWRALGDRALTVWRFDLARECFENAEDLNALFLLLLATADVKGLRGLAEKAQAKGLNNLSFATLFQLGDVKACTDLLIKTHREPEAALFARTYAPRWFFHNFDFIELLLKWYCHSQAQKAVDAWKTDLRAKGRPKISGAIATPAENGDLFEEGWEEALAREEGKITDDDVDEEEEDDDDDDEEEEEWIFLP
jgi:coatomer subunit beta'